MDQLLADVRDASLVGCYVVQPSNRPDGLHDQEHQQPADRHYVVGGARVYCEALLDPDHVHELPLHVLRDAQALLGAVSSALVAERREDDIVEKFIVDVIFNGGACSASLPPRRDCSQRSRRESPPRK